MSDKASFNDLLDVFSSVASSGQAPRAKKKRRRNNTKISTQTPAEKDDIARASYSSSKVPTASLNPLPKSAEPTPYVSSSEDVEVLPKPPPYASPSSARSQLRKLLDTQKVRQMVLGSPKPSPSKLERHTVAVCMMIVDELPTEQVWRAWYDDLSKPPSDEKAAVEPKPPPLSARFFVHAAKVSN